MEVRIATPEETAEISKLSVKVGNIPFFPGQSLIALLEHGDGDEKEIVGFAAVQNAQHAAGSWVKEEFRKQGRSYELRHALDNELRRRGIPVYFALPQSDFERHLFAKYGPVTEHNVQVRHL
jgi:N-acetylglutamate synthase-like GNAT family acetyltransferase